MFWLRWLPEHNDAHSLQPARDMTREIIAQISSAPAIEVSHTRIAYGTARGTPNDVLIAKQWSSLEPWSG